MPVYVVLAALAVTLSIPILWYAVAADRAPTQKVNRNLRAGLADGGDLRALVLSQSPVERVLQPLLQSLGGTARRISPAGVVQAMERRVELSGVKWPVERFLVLKLAGAGGLLTAGLLYASTSGSSTGLLVAITAGVVGYLAPDVVLSRMAATRQLAIANSLPDTLDQLTICVEAGLGFDAAMARTAKSGEGPLSQEIARLLQDFRVGVPRARLWTPCSNAPTSRSCASSSTPWCRPRPTACRCPVCFGPKPPSSARSGGSGRRSGP